MMLRLLCGLLLSLSISAADAAVRVKDIANLKGVRENQILGYGLVIGLKGTGDTLRNAPFTEQSLQSMLDNMGINIRGTSLRTRNVAAVVVTADLPPFVAGGSRIDVAISSLGDASSLLGGTLVMTQLRGADGETYAVAQGAIAVGGYNVEGAAQTLSQGVATAGRIPNGALIEREVKGRFSEMESLILELKNPDFVTATRIMDAINAHSSGRYQKVVAFERDYRTIVLSRPRSHRAGAVYRRNRGAAGRAGYAGASGGRRTHGNGGHRPECTDFDGRGHPWKSVGANHRGADRVAAVAIRPSW
jgi:flagellar P-ring protein precursor FlgI